ncbi:MAG: DNA polymerase III subunit gamma/tau, partial [Croceibacterium sp.]
MNESGDMFGDEPEGEVAGGEPQPTAAELEAAGQSALFGALDPEPPVPDALTAADSASAPALAPVPAPVPA